LFIDAIFTDMGRFTFRALHFDFLHSYLYYATPELELEDWSETRGEKFDFWRGARGFWYEI
jgi:hypothetical protein